MSPEWILSNADHRLLREQLAVIRRKAEEARRKHAEILITVERVERILDPQVNQAAARRTDARRTT